MALTLKSINLPGGNAGTMATASGASIFDRAMSRLSGAADKLITGERKIIAEDSASFASDLLTGLDTATAENVQDIRARTEAALDDPVLQRADKERLTAKLNNLDQEIGQREEATYSLGKQREGRATEQLLRGIDRAQFELKGGGSVEDFKNKDAAIKKAIAGIEDPEARQAAYTDLRGKAGLNKNTFGTRILNEMPKNEDGTVDQAAFAKKLREGVGSEYRYTDAEIQQLIKGREDLAGITAEKKVEAERSMARFKTRLDIAKSQAQAKGKQLPDAEVRSNLRTLNTELIKEGWLTFGTDFKDQFIGIQLEAFKAGVPLNIIEELTAKHGSTDTFLGLSPEANLEDFDAAMKIAKAEARQSGLRNFVDPLNVRLP